MCRWLHYAKEFCHVTGQAILNSPLDSLYNYFQFNVPVSPELRPVA